MLRTVLSLMVLAGAGLPAGADALGPSQVACVASGGASVTYHTRPADCILHARGKGFFGATQLSVVGLRWTGWGASHPTGTGTVVGNMGYRAKVTVTLSERVTCHGHRRYKQSRLRYPDGHVGHGALDTCTD